MRAIKAYVPEEAWRVLTAYWDSKGVTLGPLLEAFAELLQEAEAPSLTDIGAEATIARARAIQASRRRREK